MTFERWEGVMDGKMGFRSHSFPGKAGQGRAGEKRPTRRDDNYFVYEWFSLINMTMERMLI